MLLDFLSHSAFQEIPKSAQLTMVHRDAETFSESHVPATHLAPQGERWLLTVDHSYFTGRTTVFTFVTADPGPVAIAIQTAVQGAIIDHQARMFAMLASINSAVINSLDGDEIVRNVLYEVRQVLQASDAGVLRLFEAKSGFLLPVAQEGLPDEYRGYRVLPGESISGEVFTTGRPALLNGRAGIVAAHRVMRPESQSFMERSDIANALICVPVVSDGECLGTLTALCFSQAGRFAPFDLATLQSLAAQIAIGYRRSRTYQNALATARHLEEAREELTRKNRELDRAVTLHETLLRIFASETDLAAQLDAVATLYRTDFRFESMLGFYYQTANWQETDEVSALEQPVEAAGVAVGRFLIRAVGDAGMLRAIFGTVAAFTALDVMRNMSRMDILNARKIAWFEDWPTSQDARLQPRYGFHLERHVQALVAALPEGDSTLSTYRLQAELQAAQATSNVLSFHREDEIVLIVSASTASALERNLAALSRTEIVKTIQVGSSAICEGIAGLSDALLAASRAARTQQRRGRAGLLREENMGIESLLTGRTRPEIVDFTRRVLGQLLDPRHHQLHETLIHYLNEGGSASRAASALNIHTNTLYLRLQRIEALIERSPSNPADFVLLSLACQLEIDYDMTKLRGSTV